MDDKQDALEIIKEIMYLLNRLYAEYTPMRYKYFKRFSVIDEKIHKLYDSISNTKE